MGKIFEVTVTVCLYSYGEPPLDAFDLADAVKHSMVARGGFIDSYTPVLTADGLSENLLDEVPFGPGGDLKTIREWLQDGKS